MVDDDGVYVCVVLFHVCGFFCVNYESVHFLATMRVYVYIYIYI